MKPLSLLEVSVQVTVTLALLVLTTNAVAFTLVGAVGGRFTPAVLENPEAAVTIGYGAARYLIAVMPVMVLLAFYVLDTAVQRARGRRWREQSTAA